MRKISQEASQAFEWGNDYKNANTEVKNNGELYLYGNEIARHEGSGVIAITLAGWNTSTTRERLNALQGVKVSTKKGQAYLNGKAWNGEWVTITR